MKLQPGKKGASVITIILFVLLIGVCIFLAYSLGKERAMKQESKLSPTTIPTAALMAPKETNATDSPTLAPTDAVQGSIEGTLIYPSSFIPKDMNVCAEDTTTKKQYCTDKQIIVSGKTGYHIDLPPGTYNVYAFLANGKVDGAGFDKTYRAYYNDFVVCGLKYGCPSHKPIDVMVTTDKTNSDINPQDWYNTP